MGFQNFYELDAWKRAREFKIALYAVIKRFPEHERYELTSQIRRSARSIPTNISEGYGRRTAKDQNSFCVIARGSLSETLNHLIDAYDCGYISKEELCKLKEQWDECGKVLNGYMSFLQSKGDLKGKTSNEIGEEHIAYLATRENELHEEFFLHLKAN